MPGNRELWSAAVRSSRFGPAVSSDERSCALPFGTASLFDPHPAASPVPASGEILSGCLMIERSRDCLAMQHAKPGPGADGFGEPIHTAFVVRSQCDA